MFWVNSTFGVLHLNFKLLLLTILIITAVIIIQMNNKIFCIMTLIADFVHIGSSFGICPCPCPCQGSKLM